LGERFSKYPPSPGFLAVTVGALCLVLGLAQFLEEKGISLGLLQTYGKAPFFFYVAHLLLYSLVPSLSGKCGHFSLPTTYAAWLAGLAILYFPCRWYYDVRQSHKESLLKYL
jgi:ABC-type tungstate transport system substrate-binding protein